MEWETLLEVQCHYFRVAILYAVYTFLKLFFRVRTLRRLVGGKKRVGIVLFNSCHRICRIATNQ